MMRLFLTIVFALILVLLLALSGAMQNTLYAPGRRARNAGRLNIVQHFQGLAKPRFCQSEVQTSRTYFCTSLSDPLKQLTSYQKRTDTRS